MKKLLIYIFLIMSVAAVQKTFAALDPSEMTDYEVIKNRGYSSEMARLINIRCAQAAGYSPELINNDPDYYKNFNWFRKFFIYLDPALDDGSFMRHDINPVPSVHDL